MAGAEDFALIRSDWEARLRDLDWDEARVRGSVPEGTEEAMAVVRLVLEHAFERGAAAVHITPSRSGALVKERILGAVELLDPPLPMALYAQVVGALKELAGLPTDTRGQPLRGSALIELTHGPVDLHVSSYPGALGDALTARLIDPENTARSFDELFSADIVDGLSTVMQRGHGIVLTAGPTGSGKSTSLYALLAMVATPERHVVTIEEHMHVHLDGVVQGLVTERFGVIDALRAALMQDPDVVMVHQLNESEEIRLAFDVGRTGHLLLSSFHANDAVGAVQELMRLGDLAGETVGEGLLAVLAHRLVPRSCAHCARARRLSEMEARSLGLWPDGVGMEVSTNEGCAKCETKGTLARALACELLTMTPAVAAALRGGSARRIRDALGPDFVSIEDDIRRLLRERVVSVETALRILGPLYELSKALDAMAESVAVDQPDIAMASLGGTVTILFTDIIGSTAWTARVGDRAWIEVLREHHARIREQVEAWNGVEVKSTGDGFMLAFPSTSGAVRCALAIQDSMRSIELPGGKTLELHVGLHVGEPVRDGEDFYGTTVNFAARVASAGRAGEVLVSELARSLLSTSGEFEFGPPRLVEMKGFDGAQPVYPVSP